MIRSHVKHLREGEMQKPAGERKVFKCADDFDDDSKNLLLITTGRKGTWASMAGRIKIALTNDENWALLTQVRSVNLFVFLFPCQFHVFHVYMGMIFFIYVRIYFHVFFSGIGV